MNTLQLVATLIKIAVVLGFVLGIGGALTWNDRRMSSMMQDRIGPNRAAFVLPKWLASGMFAAPGLLVGAALALWVFLLSPTPETAAQSQRATERILITLELSVLITWIGLAALTAFLAKRTPSNAIESWLKDVGDPRKIFYAGVVAHLLLIVTRYAISGTDLSASAKPVLFKAAPLLLAAVIVLSALYTAYLVPKEGFRLRMAGLLHTAADGLKMIFKEDIIPNNADRLMHAIAPMIAMLPPARGARGRAVRRCRVPG